MIRTGLLGKAWGWAADGLPIAANTAMATTNANLRAADPPIPCAPWRMLAKYSLKEATRGRQRKWRRSDNGGAVADSRARAQATPLRTTIFRSRYSTDIELFSDAKLEEPAP
jgi:hypothetical protein